MPMPVIPRANVAKVTVRLLVAMAEAAWGCVATIESVHILRRGDGVHHLRAEEAMGETWVMTLRPSLLWSPGRR